MKNSTQYPAQKPECARQMSFLLRLWRASGPRTPNWQASLEVAGTGKRIGFANLEQLFAYLIEISEGDLNGISQGDSANPSDQYQSNL